MLVERRWDRLRVLNLAVNNIRTVGQLEQFPKLDIAYFRTFLCKFREKSAQLRVEDVFVRKELQEWVVPLLG